MNVNKELKDYIENNIFPEYEKNDKGHNLQHINYVINRSIKFADTVPDLNYNIVYTVAAYHDIGHHIDPETKKWERLFNYVAKELQNDKRKKIMEFGSGCGQLASMLQKAGYDAASTDIVHAFLNE